MKTLFRNPGLCLLIIILTAVTAGGAGTRAPARSDQLLGTMQRELHRAQENLGKLDPAAYFISYAVHDDDTVIISASQGGIVISNHYQRRTGDISMRVGSAALDNSHGTSRPSAISTVALPLEDDPDAITRLLWHTTYEEYRKAVKAYLSVKSSTQVRAQEEDTSADFSQESPQSHADYAASAKAPDQHALEERVRQYSLLFRKYPHVYSSFASLTVRRANMHFVSSEGSAIVAPSAVVRLVVEAQTRADDGMDLIRVETFQVESVDKLPSDGEIQGRIEKIATDLKALRTAPLAEPYDGPALLSARASAVFFHEVLGHRLEGHRQRGETEGQTFTKKINQAVLPEFLSITDDPTQRALNGMQLGGWYEYDEEGMPAAPVELIKNGVLKNFLMSRMPIRNFDKSNGHGRAQGGLMPTGRQGNLIVTSSSATKDAELRQRLIDEVKKQGKSYGLYFEDIQGGFTLTQRAAPQTFQVLPVLVWRVYPDGRPDELVRGVNIVGTPLAAMARILLTGDKTEIFNGMCGAESGYIPVAAAAPAMLFSEIEVQKQTHSLNRPPILAPPGFETPAADAKTGGGR